VVVGGVGTSLLQPTGGSSDSASAGSTAEVAPSAGGDSASSADQDGSGNAARAEVGRQVVTTGSATVRVVDPGRSADRLARWVDEAGGRVDQRSELRSGGDDASTTMTVRVPAADVDRAVTTLRREGSVEALDLARDDVTTQVADLDARIRSLTTSVERLREILAEADDATDLLAVEKSLSDRQAELESLQAQRRVVGDQVALATLTVTLVASDGPAAVEPGGFVGGLRSGWDGLAASMNLAVRVVGVLLPWTAVGAALWAAWWLVHRRGSSRAGRVPPG
jgi:glycine cleavage system regulatory protein